MDKRNFITCTSIGGSWQTFRFLYVISSMIILKKEIVVFKTELIEVFDRP